MLKATYWNLRVMRFAKYLSSLSAFHWWIKQGINIGHRYIEIHTHQYQSGIGSLTFPTLVCSSHAIRFHPLFILRSYYGFIELYLNKFV